MSDYPCLSYQVGSYGKLLFSRFEQPRPPYDQPKVVGKTRYLRRRTLTEYQRQINCCFIYRNPCYFEKSCLKIKKSKGLVHLCKQKVDHVGIYLNKQEDLEVAFALHKEPSEDIIFSVDICTVSRDINADNLYLTSYTRENNQKSASQFVMLNTS